MELYLPDIPLCLPTNDDTTVSTANHAPPDAKETPLLTTQDSSDGDRHAKNADDELTESAPVQLPPAAQGSKRRSGIATDQTDVDDAPTNFLGRIANSIYNTFTGPVDDNILGTQATGASDDNNNDANQPGLTFGGTVDGEDEEEVESDEPGGTAQGRGDTVVWVRNVEG